MADQCWPPTPALGCVAPSARCRPCDFRAVGLRIVLETGRGRGLRFPCSCLPGRAQSVAARDGGGRHGSAPRVKQLVNSARHRALPPNRAIPPQARRYVLRPGWWGDRNAGRCDPPGLGRPAPWLPGRPQRRTLRPSRPGGPPGCGTAYGGRRRAPQPKLRGPCGEAGSGGDRCGHLLILVTRPAPTVRPPSRMANFRPSSMAMGWISSTVISVLSPGMTISVPSGRCTTPVTSVVRK